MQVADFEDAIIGACLRQDEQEQKRVLRILAPELAPDRFSEKKRMIYEAILDCWVQGKPVDILNVAQFLGDKLDGIGGLKELRYYASSLDRLGISSTAGLENWAIVIDNAGRLRQMNLLVAEYHDKLKDFEKLMEPQDFDVDSFVSDFITRIRQSQGTIKGGYSPIAEWVDKWQSELQVRQQGRLVGRLPTGWPIWDNKIVGLPKGELTVLCGLPSTGKTQMAIQIACNVASQLKAQDKKGCVVIHSLEMSGNDLIERLACAYSKTDSRSLHQKKIDPEIFEKVSKVSSGLKSLPIYLDDSDFANSSRIELQASAYHEERGPIRLIVIDFAELVMDERDFSEELRVSGIYRKAKSLAKNLNTSVLLVAQYNRVVAQRDDKLGTNFDIRYSGFAEIAAGAIFHIYNPYQLRLMSIPVSPPREYPIMDNVAYIITGKNKGGPTGDWPMNWYPNWTLWIDESAPTQIGATWEEDF